MARGLIPMSSCGRESEQLWTVGEVAYYLRVPVQTLYQWRRKKVGPAAKRCGRHLRYDPSAVRRWVTGNEEGHAP
jgi:excisionase family DNA binding protein